MGPVGGVILEPPYDTHYVDYEIEEVHNKHRVVFLLIH